LTANQVCGLVESVKTGSDLQAPLDGMVTAVNERLQNNPELINDKPYDAWIFKFRNDNADLSGLLDTGAYRKLTEA
jgi:glycine cleavage system H protein